MHGLLERQLRKLGLEQPGAPTLAAWETFLARVDAVYESGDRDRYTLEQSMNVCSGEIQDLQKRLSSERDRLSAMVTSMGDALCVLDADGKIDFANPAAENLLDATPGALAGRDLVDIVSGSWPREKERREGIRALTRCITSGESCRLDDVRFITCQRLVLSVSFVVTPILRDGAARGTVIIFRDISERRATEDALRESETRFRAIFASAGVGIVRLWLDGRIAECNLAYAGMLGLEPNDLVGRSMFDLLHPSERAGASESMEATRRRAPSVPVERQYTHKDGSIVWAGVSWSLVETERGEPLFYINVVANVTQRKVLEVELRHAQKLESVGRLAAGVAHEINTPIQFIGDNIHFLETSFNSLLELNAGKDALLAETSSLVPGLTQRVAALTAHADVDYLVEEVPKAITQSLEGIAQVARIVHAMKQFSHPDPGDSQSVVDLGAALQSTLTVARSELKHVADVQTELGELPLVPCYAGDLNQVFLNLLINAAHAIGDVVASTGSRGRITIRTAIEGEFAVISIGDTGTGIPEAIRPRIFDPFFTTKEVGKGTGQGLALARGVVVDKHHGQLTFESEVGKGTVFHVKLPLAGAKAEAAE